MKRWLLPWLMLLTLSGLAPAAEKAGTTFYVQLIRGTDDDKPPAPEARLVGSAVSRRLQMFKWKNYWEIDERAVVVSPGGKSRQRMSAKREVEIALLTPQEMTISLFADGKMTRRRKQPVETPFYIAGGDNEAAQSWFIVVRHDKPQAGQGGLN